MGVRAYMDAMPLVYYVCFLIWRNVHAQMRFLIRLSKASTKEE